MSMIASINSDSRERSVAQQTRRRRRRSRSAWTRPTTIIALAVIVIAVAWALVPSLFSTHDPYTSYSQALLAPSGEHIFGTDALGRDLYSRVVHGSRQSLLGALIAVLLGLVFGTIIGLIAGTSRGWLDAILMRIVDVLLAVPSLLLSLSVIILLGFGTTNAAIAVGVTSVATFARLARSQVISVANSNYVEAAYGSGGTRLSVLWRHILPNSFSAVLALAAVQFGMAILNLSILGFLGYGAPPPIAEWGLLIADAREYMATSWWLTVLPGLVIVAVVVSANHVSQIIQKESLR